MYIQLVTYCINYVGWSLEAVSDIYTCFSHFPDTTLYVFTIVQMVVSGRKLEIPPWSTTLVEVITFNLTLYLPRCVFLILDKKINQGNLIGLKFGRRREEMTSYTKNGSPN